MKKMIGIFLFGLSIGSVLAEPIEKCNWGSINDTLIYKNETGKGLNFRVYGNPKQKNFLFIFHEGADPDTNELISCKSAEEAYDFFSRFVWEYDLRLNKDFDKQLNRKEI